MEKDISVRINTLSDDEIRAIGDAFGNYKYEEGEAGLLSLGKSRQTLLGQKGIYHHLVELQTS